MRKADKTLRRRGGYTLIEILVVLAIIASITAIVFAAFGQSRERARESVCTSQMHQWGVAIAMYCQDYDGGTPAKGVPMKTWQVGLPPGWILYPQFVQQYHLEKLLDCPSTHYPSTLPRSRIPLISYKIAVFAPDNEAAFSDIISYYGINYPLIVCDMHNADTDFDHQPTWAKKRLLVLRWDQHIQNEIVPVHLDMPGI